MIEVHSKVHIDGVKGEGGWSDTTENNVWLDVRNDEANPDNVILKHGDWEISIDGNDLLRAVSNGLNS